MKYAPHDPDYWEYVDIKQVERREQELMSDKIIDHYIGHDNYTPEYCIPVVSRDFDEGFIYALLLCIPFWGTLIGIVWLANILIGGG